MLNACAVAAAALLLLSTCREGRSHVHTIYAPLLLFSINLICSVRRAMGFAAVEPPVYTHIPYSCERTRCARMLGVIIMNINNVGGVYYVGCVVCYVFCTRVHVINVCAVYSPFINVIVPKSCANANMYVLCLRSSHVELEPGIFASCGKITNAIPLFRRMT